ncbi:hypothetical protein HYFRA_00011531 [Hymenoscyphus fraxineus]|uniref:Zn(2)-C6 fungal-type domain-containing protein n=1 Tax=Hymenoscyphus fraxineus TaxID=746836 RepID=A0A9N9L3Z9_9HELO|nr:hypothetical protein HYFRA_00011531 [Hymenoscyphus fraxineus]
MSSPPNHRSIRSSCERCRTQKLKCTSGSEFYSSRCTRCARAKLECIYSRRSRANRTTEEQGVAENVQTETMLQTAEPDSNSLLPDWSFWSSEKWVDDMNSNVLISEPGFWDSPEQVNAPYTLGDIATSPSTFPCIIDGEGGSPGFPVQLELPKKEDTSSTAQLLARLVERIHKTLDTLRDDSSSRNPIPVDSYPIGCVLNLTQDFLDALGKVQLQPSVQSNSTSPHQGLPTAITPSENPTPIKADELSTLASSTVNTSSILLALSCYISLRNLYNTLFTHFQRYLSLVPETPSDYRSPRINPDHGRNFKLSDIDSSNEVCKIHKAFRILLGAFQSVEDVVGLPDSHRAVKVSLDRKEQKITGASLFQQDLAQCFFEKDITGVFESKHQENSGLLASIHLLKALIRQKMDLDL